MWWSKIHHRFCRTDHRNRLQVLCALPLLLVKRIYRHCRVIFIDQRISHYTFAALCVKHYRNKWKSFTASFEALFIFTVDLQFRLTNAFSIRRLSVALVIALFVPVKKVTYEERFFDSLGLIIWLLNLKYKCFTAKMTSHIWETLTWDVPTSSWH